MPDPTNRFLKLKSPLPADRCAVTRLSGVERVNELYEFEVHVVVTETPLADDDLLGEVVTIELEGSGMSRAIHGLVRAIRQIDAKGDNVFAYMLELVPPMWLMSLSSHNQIFTEKSTLQIVETVIKDCSPKIKFKVGTSGKYSKREYCVQYDETDLEFVVRLLAEEGISFSFEHQKGGVYLNLIDRMSGFPQCDPSNYTYEEGKPTGWSTDLVTSFRRARHLTTGEITSIDYGEDAPNPLNKETMKTKRKNISTVSPGKRQIYGRHNFEPGSRKFSGSTKQQVQSWLDGYQGPEQKYEGASGAFSFSAGSKFALGDKPDAVSSGTEFLLLEVTHNAVDGLDEQSAYSNQFTCCETKASGFGFVPRIIPERPRIWGVQTAVVTDITSPKNEHADIKVQFPWDEAETSCWARVAQLYAGGQWGAHFIPRIGQEVIVEFLNGDPDRPLVTGAVYNAENKAPFAKDEEYDPTTQSGIKTESDHELLFDDTSGSEEVYFYSKRDHVFKIENDQTGDVEHDQKLTVKNDQTIEVNGEQSTTVDKDRKIVVEGNQSTEVKKNQSTKVTGNQSAKVNGNVEVDATGAVTIKSAQSIEFKVGASSIKVEHKGVTIKGPMITVTGNATTDISGVGMLQLKGGLVKIN